MGSRESKASSQRTAPPVSEKVMITSSDRVQLELKLQRDKLAAAIRKYESSAKEERTKASEFLRSGNRRKALYCLKREQAQRSQVTTVTDMLNNVQSLLDTVEFSQIEMEVFHALKTGKDELSKLNSMLNVDDIAELMDGTAETIEEARRIDALLAQPLDGFDEDALINELMSEDPIVHPESEPGLKHVVVPAHDLPLTEKQENHVSNNRLDEAMLPA
ncbi:charged multivesicular body protein 6 [Trypanosoma theileri]|uniref:Charged multivesicular body protein 6 n=1 Tax=Trypanosoma theileri TaxID=67003 RepID=A0A1X0NZJ9_9TRYP|nr:charged multivesicular body protein 6 [Trypanosoma theileri]ORC89913.1 charged multivesicular body protein 6 [Trypanosoma theileri]